MRSVVFSFLGYIILYYDILKLKEDEIKEMNKWLRKKFYKIAVDKFGP